MATIRIMSGGAPKEIFLQLTPQFEGQSGHKVDYVFAVMSALRDRLAAGEKADVLVMPHTSTPVSERYASPLKLFEYMAAGKAIVASRLPSLGEVLTDEVNALLVTPGDADALADELAAQALGVVDQRRLDGAVYADAVVSPRVGSRRVEDDRAAVVE